MWSPNERSWLQEKVNTLVWMYTYEPRQMALYFQSVIWVMAFQNFAQKHSKSDMPLLLLYCLIESFGSACSAVLCILYLCVWVIFSGGGLVLSEAMFSHFEKRIFSILFNMQKTFFLIELLFPPPHFLGVLFFVCFCLFFCNAASPKACWELSDHYTSCFVATLLQ